MSKRIFGNWQEIEEIRFLSRIERIINIYQRSQISNLKTCLNNWRNISKDLKIQDFENEKQEIDERLKDYSNNQPEIVIPEDHSAKR